MLKREETMSVSLGVGWWEVNKLGTVGLLGRLRTDLR